MRELFLDRSKLKLHCKDGLRELARADRLPSSCRNIYGKKFLSNHISIFNVTYVSKSISNQISIKYVCLLAITKPEISVIQTFKKRN